MQYNLYGYFFQESPTQVVQFRIDLSKQAVFRFELDDRLMPIRNSIFMVDVTGLKEALVYITCELVQADVRAGVTPKTNTDALVDELLLHLNPDDFLTLFGDPAKYDDQLAVSHFLSQLGHQKLETVSKQHYLVNDFVHA